MTGIESRDCIEDVGFERPRRRARDLAAQIFRAQLVTTVCLVVSIAVAATAVSIGIARADTAAAFGGGNESPFALAAALGLFFAAMGGIVASVTARADERTQRR